MMNRCLICYEPSEEEYHDKCAEWLFEDKHIPILDFGVDNLKELAQKVIASQANVTGAQAKISLSVVNNEQGIGKLAIDFKGQFILKPPSERYPGMPEVEAATMRMADTTHLNVVPYGLIRMADGNLAYITRRVDRRKGEKLPQEDMCQLTERLTEDKYKSSYEQIGKAIDKFALYPALTKVSFFQVVLFSFLHGNTDMHLKNFSLTYDDKVKGMMLTPSYDLLNTQILLPDHEQTALTLNGKRSNLNWSDFEALAINLRLNSRQIKQINRQMLRARVSYNSTIANSFMSEELKEHYLDEIDKNYKVLNGK